MSWNNKKKPKVISKRKYFMDLKTPDTVRISHPKTVQEMLEIWKIAPNGIFQVGKEKWSRTFLIVDINYNTRTYEEQLSFFYDWCKTLNAFDIAVKITIFNEHRNMEEIREKILYPHKNDAYDWLRDAYNDIIEKKIIEGKQGICQEKFLTITVKRNDYESARAYLATLEAAFMNNFAALTSALIPLNANERLSVLNKFFHIGKEESVSFDVEEEMLYGHDIKNDIVNDSMEIGTDYFKMDDVIGTVLYLDPQSYPTSLEDKFLNDMANLPIESMYTVDYEPIPQDVAVKTLEEKLMGVERTITKQQEKRNSNGNFSSDISYRVRREKEEIEKMLDQLRENDQKMFWVGVSAVILAKDEEELSDRVTSVSQIAEKATCRIAPYYLRQREALDTALPIGGRYVEKMRALFTSSAGVFMPFNIVEMQMTDEPFYYGVNQVSKEPILANRKSLFNGNGFVFGLPGGGKSLTGCKMEAGSVFLRTDDDIIFVDPTLEYFDVAEAYGGAVINLASYTNQYLNPMEIDLELLDVDDTSGQVREKCEFMLGICDQAMRGGLKPEHESIIDRCVRHLYGKIALKPMEEREQPVMSDFMDIIKQQEEQEAKDIALVMELFTEGSLNIFNHPGNVDIENRVIVYGLRDLGDKLSGVAMLVMLESIRQRIIRNFKRGRATWLYIDEFHVVMRKSYSRDYFISLWKQVRKLGGLCTGITQNIVELLEDKITSTLVSNSEYIILLKQAGPDADALLKAFPNISTAQMKYATNAAKGTGLVKFGDTVIPFDNRIDKENPVYDVYNTNMHEKIAKKKAGAGV